ncbi:MAG TPA: carboxypeptidase-like regulatory domain-containing protein [Gemmatimonadales bacterium]|nr:carboxypeptidase-like regulatory domain-containing protein [Gemmatimonadales bacterium]
MSFRLRTLALLAFFAACHSDGGLGANAPSLSGTLSSPRHGPIAHASVIATDSANAASSDTTTTDANGHFSFYGLAPGTRTLSVATQTLPGGCFPPALSRVTLTSGKSPFLNLALDCVPVAGTYSGYATLTLGGTAAALDTELVSIGLEGYLPDSAGLTATVSQYNDSSFAMDLQYVTTVYTGALSSGLVTIQGPVVFGQLALVIPPVTQTIGAPPLGISVTITTTCQPSAPQSLTVRTDSTYLGHVASIVGDADYACSVSIPGIGDYSGTLNFHLVATYTGPEAVTQASAPEL